MDAAPGLAGLGGADRAAERQLQKGKPDLNVLFQYQYARAHWPK